MLGKGLLMISTKIMMTLIRLHRFGDSDTAMQNEIALSYHTVRGLYFLEVSFATSIWAIPRQS